MKRLFSGVAALVVLVLCGCSPRPPEATTASGPATASASGTPSASPGPSLDVVSRATGARSGRFTAMDPSGRVQYDIRAVESHYHDRGDGTSVTTFDNPHIIFHAKDGRTVVADAPEAVASSKDKTITMNGGVRTKTQDGKIMTARTLTYDQIHDTLRGSGDVELTDTRTNEKAYGDYVRSDLKFENVYLGATP